jgi:glycosyltransferase involved in cell wall biosynthesis
MKIGFGILAYNSEKYIDQSFGCLLPYVDKHAVRVDEKTTDNTCEIVSKTTLEIPMLCVGTMKMFTWKHDYAYAKNLLVDDLSDCDWLIIFDDDEKLEPEAAKRLVEYIRTLENTQIDGLEIPMIQCFPRWEASDMVPEFGVGNAHLSVFRKGYRFVNKVHESVPVPEEKRVKSQYFIDNDIIIRHFAWKGDRSKFEAPKHWYYRDLSEGKTFQDGEHMW